MTCTGCGLGDIWLISDGSGGARFPGDRLWNKYVCTTRDEEVVV